MRGAMPGAAQKRPCLFIYGTLMIGSGHAMARRLARESRPVGPGTAPGRLYDLGAYPGAVEAEGAGACIHGQVVRLNHPGRSLSWLDVYEGCGESDTEPHAYRRVLAPVRLATGDRVDAWMYFYRGALGGARLIRSGRYFMPRRYNTVLLRIGMQLP
jgi:gamma-glutamylcyclotransferase (GGCT)/AIG2-like uncharacterized protein YtfP